MRRLLRFFTLLVLVALLGCGGEAAEELDPTWETDIKPIMERTCVRCHTDVHEGAVGEACQSCHTTEVWSPTLFDVARHAETAFPLEGKHTEAACSSCHPSGKLVDLPMECARCHVDRHRRKLVDQCTDCHSVQGFLPVDGFDHAGAFHPNTGREGKRVEAASMVCIDVVETDNGVPDPDFGEAVTAVVVLEPGTALEAQDVIAHVRAHAANFKVPKNVYFVDNLPRNTMGKVQKNILRKLYPSR